MHELTSLEVDPYGKILELTDDALFDYPFVYLIEPGRMFLDEAEVVALRRYLLSGGFMMVDDFWGVREWENFYENIKRVFPTANNRNWKSITRSSTAFDLKEEPQIPGIAWFVRYGMRYEARRGENCETPHYRAIFDDRGRIMVMICHNTDLGDGWEREGLDSGYFKEFSEKWSYPMGINIVIYAMTH